ncbi:hypothetical protein GCM10009664_65340 [Kitasatospora gansuensis]
MISRASVQPAVLSEAAEGAAAVRCSGAMVTAVLLKRRGRDDGGRVWPGGYDQPYGSVGYDTVSCPDRK